MNTYTDLYENVYLTGSHPFENRCIYIHTQNVYKKIYIYIHMYKGFDAICRFSMDLDVSHVD